jgi:hypothetical protein
MLQVGEAVRALESEQASTYVQRRTLIQAAEGDLDAAGMLAYADVC